MKPITYIQPEVILITDNLVSSAVCTSFKDGSIEDLTLTDEDW